MADTQVAIDPDLVVTEGERIAVIVISVLIFILLVIQIALLIYCFCRKRCAERCPCFKDREKEAHPGGSHYTDWREERLSVRSDEEHLIRTEHYASDDSEKPVVENINEFKPVVPPHLRKPTDGEKDDDKLGKDEDGDSDEKDPDDKDPTGVRGDPGQTARTLEKILTPGADEGEQPKVQEGPEDTDPRGREVEKPRGREGQGRDTDIEHPPDGNLPPGADGDSEPRGKPGPGDTDPRGKDGGDPTGEEGEEGHTDITPVVTLIPGKEEEETDPKVHSGPPDTDPKGRDGEDLRNTDRVEGHLNGSDDEGEKHKKGGGMTGEEVTSSSDTTSCTSETSDDTLHQQVYMTLPGQTGGEDVPFLRDDGDIRGRGRKFRRPISEHSQGLPSGLPRFSLPPIGVVGAWEDERDDDPPKRSEPKLWTMELSPEEDQGYSDSSRRKGSKEDGTISTASTPDEPGTSGAAGDGSTSNVHGGPKSTDKDNAGKGKGKSGHGKGGKTKGKGGTPGQDADIDNGDDGSVTTGGTKMKYPKKAYGKPEKTTEDGGDTLSKPRGKGGKVTGKPNATPTQGGARVGEDGEADPTRKVTNEEDSGISDFGRGNGGSSTDDVSRGGFTGRPGEYFIDDDDLSSIGEDGWKYWPDTTGRFRGMDQWSSDGGRNEDDLNIEDVEFDDDNKLMRTGESFQYKDPENDEDAGPKVKDQDKKQKHRQKPQRGKSGKGSPSRQKGKQLPKGRDKTGPNTPGTKDTEEMGDESSNGWESSYGDSSDTGTDTRKLGRPPIKDDQSEPHTFTEWNGSGTDRSKDGRKTQAPVRLGRGIPSDAILEEEPGEGDDTPTTPGNYTKSKKPKRKEGRDPSETKGGKKDVGSEDQESGSLDDGEPYADGRKTVDAKGKPHISRNEHDGGKSQDTGPVSKRGSRRKPRRDGTLPDEPLSESDGVDPLKRGDGAGTHEPGNKRRRRRKKGPKSRRGPRGVNKNSWDAYLDHDSNLTSPLEFIFFDADFDRR